MSKVAIVAPCHIQPSKAWVAALEHARIHEKADIIIVDDSNGKLSLPDKWDIYGYARQRVCLGDRLYALFEDFHHSSACKQFGLWRAYKRGYDYVIVVDSDCIIPKDFVKRHLSAISGSGHGWDNPLEGTEFFSRGFPYSKRNLPIAAHMGLWDSELDLYGTDRVGFEYERQEAPTHQEPVRVAGYMPLSGMNVCFRRDAIPYMLFLPDIQVGAQQWFTRHDDIWGGYIFQKIMKMKGAALSYGDPKIFHDTIVDPEEDALAEIPMIQYEDDFYAFVDSYLDLRPGMKLAPASEIFAYLAGAQAAGPFAGFLAAFDFQAKAYA